MSRFRSGCSIRAMLLVCGVSVAAVSQAATVTGRVSDASGFRVLPGAQLTLVEAGRVTYAATDGTFRFADVAPGTYRLRASYVGAETVDRSITVSADGALAIDLALGAPGADYLENVLVVGQRANLSSSLSRQRASDSTRSVLTRDAIGQFPDQNVAEAIRRAPGVNVLNDQGEGRFIAIRGLDPNLNSSSINGVRVPAPESDIRAVALDVVPAELVESIEITKSLTPDMDGDTIGAAIEIKTPSAFGRRRSFASVSFEGSYNDLNEKVSPKGALDFSYLVNDRFGVAGGVSYYARKFATDNIEAGDWNEENGVGWAESVEYRDYDVERKRLGATLSLDFRLDDDTTLYARTMFSRFEDQEIRRRLILEMDEAPGAGSETTASFASADGQIRVERDLKDRNEVQKIQAFSIGGETHKGPWTIEYQASHARASERENGSLDPVTFRRDFEDAGELGVTFDYSKLERPTFTVDPASAALFSDPAEYEFESIERTTLSAAKDEETAFKLDLAREFALTGGGSFELRGGVKHRSRDKRYNLQLDVFDGFDGDFTLTDVAGSQSYGLASLDPLVNPSALRDFVTANLAGFERDDVDSAFESAVSDFDVEEDISAGYLLGRLDRERLRVIGGLRVERTRNDIRGNLVELVEEGGTRNGVVLDEDTVFVSPTAFKRRYTDLLPSINVRFEPMRDVVLRAGGYRSLVRPNIGNLAPRFVVEENDEGDREGEFGNPDLKPYKAWNVDLGAEWYYAEKAVLQAGVFRKWIDDFIVLAEFEDVTLNGVSASEALVPVNGRRADVQGVELGWQHAFTGLPAPFDGLLMGLNYTYTDAEGEIDDRSIRLPAASKHTLNGVLGYEKGRWSVRVAAAYRSGYLDELGGDADEDRLVKSHLQWDLSARLRLTPSLQIFAELVNLGDEPYVAYQRGPGRERLLQYEEYSWTAKFGFRANLK